MLANQHLEALVLDDHILDPAVHLPDLIVGGSDVEGLAGKALSVAGIAVAHPFEIGRGLPHLPVLCPFPQSVLHGPAPFHRDKPVDDFQLGFQMHIGITGSIMKPEPVRKCISCVDGQQIQLQQEFCGSVLDDFEQVVQFSVQIVVDFKFVLRLSQQHSTAAAEDFDIAVVFQREYGVNDRQQVCLVADTG